MIRHGSHSTYRAGCRCASCRGAHRVYIRQQRVRRRPQELRERARRHLDKARELVKQAAILDGEGEKCPTCGGTDRDGGTVATSGPDEFGNYETDDCPDDFHR